ncbi:MAG: hypothetical protein PHU25_22030 [Deltaproteobacteria bacterium]|nr:hypothetical protein [Deltaproteobacteria bacterium]
MELEELVQRIQRWKERSGLSTGEQASAPSGFQGAPPPLPTYADDTAGIEPVESSSQTGPDQTSEMSLDEGEEVKEHE